MDIRLKLVPATFQELLSYLTPNTLEVMDWGAFWSDSGVIFRRLLRKEGALDLRKKLEPRLPARTTFGKGGQRFEKLADGLKTEVGNTLARLFFSQLGSEDGLFLDLRQTRFSYDSDRGLLWDPNGLWVSFDPVTRGGLIDLYGAFYSGDEDAFDQAIHRIGMAGENPTLEHLKELRQLLTNAFGPDESGVHELSTAKIRKGFQQLFQYCIAQKICLKPVFIYFGVYLTTLTMSLEKLGSRFDLEKNFREANL